MHLYTVCSLFSWFLPFGHGAGAGTGSAVHLNHLGVHQEGAGLKQGDLEGQVGSPRPPGRDGQSWRILCPDLLQGDHETTAVTLRGEGLGAERHRRQHRLFIGTSHRKGSIPKNTQRHE